MIKPYNRRELYIAALSDSSLTIPDYPYSREEIYLAKINGQNVTIPTAPANRYETYLAKLAGEDVTIPEPVSRLEMFLYAACGNDIVLPTPASREEDLWNNYINSSVFKITTQPKDATAADGQTVHFTVAVKGGAEPYAYQWKYKSPTGTWYDVNAPSGKTSDYTFVARERTNGYQYYCVVTDDAGATVDSDIATLTVTSA